MLHACVMHQIVQILFRTLTKDKSSVEYAEFIMGSKFHFSQFADNFLKFQVME